MGNSFDDDFTIKNITSLKEQYNKGAAFYHLRCFEFGTNGRNTQLVIQDDTGLTSGAGKYEHLSFGNGTADEAFSVAFWIYMETSDSAYLIDKISEEDGGEWQIYYTSAGKIKFTLHDESADANIIALTDSSIEESVFHKWAHIVCTYDATEANTGLKIYINGSEEDTTKLGNGTYTAMEKLASVPVYIGGTLSDPDSENFNGKIAEIAFFQKELSQAEITELYNLYFNTHYKDLTIINSDYNGNQMGGVDRWSDLVFTGPGHGLYYKSPLYNHSAFSSLSAGFLAGNGVTGSASETWYKQSIVKLSSSPSDVIKVYNIADTGSAGINFATSSIGTTYNPYLGQISDLDMNETGSTYPTDRAADFGAVPPIGLNIPGPVGLRGRTTPYKVTKK